MDLDKYNHLTSSSNIPSAFKSISENIFSGKRITFDEGVTLFREADLSLLALLANHVRERLNGNATYFNRNFHIEPTNLCVFACKFCSYSRTLKQKEEGWGLSEEEILDRVQRYDGKPITEVHIVGGVHPHMDLYFFCDVLRKIKQHRPELHIKGFTAVELDYM
ncbi:MAG TPA: radical SAM protein, partial [Bacteroidia bacterium]|nr:radical SAM protein [Bacteroidia bacterium]